MFVYIFSTHMMALCTRFDICPSGKMESDQGTQTELHVLGLIELIENPNTQLVLYKYHLYNILIDFWDVLFGRLVDTFEEYLKVIIVHPTVYFSCVLSM